MKRDIQQPWQDEKRFLIQQNIAMENSEVFV